MFSISAQSSRRLKNTKSHKLAKFLHTNVLSNERAGRILAGVSVLGVLGLAIIISPYFLLLQIFISGNLIWSGITDNCHIKTILSKLGYKTERALGRHEQANEKRSTHNV